jgi:hypothetical protein
MGRCGNASRCHRIHPFDSLSFLPQVLEQKTLRELGLTQASPQAPCASPQSAPALSAPHVIQGKLPTTTTTSTNATLRPQRQVPSANFEKNRVFAVGLAGILQQTPVRPSANRSHTSHTVSISNNYVHNWDTLHGLHPISKPDNALSDTSSVSEDMTVPQKYREPNWDPDTGCWEPHADSKAWSDSDATTEDMQAPSEGSRSPHSVSHAYTTDASSVNGAQVPPMKQQKHPRPKINERCRRWLRNECDLGYQCNFVHEDLEYDPPVSFDLSPCKCPFHIILTGTQEIF